MTRWLLIASDGYGCHDESGLRYVSHCGRTFVPDDIDLVRYEGPPITIILTRRSGLTV